MTSPEARLNSFLPYLDAQQAAALLIWHHKTKTCEVETALKELLAAYPIGWAAEELGWSLRGLPLDLKYLNKSTEGFWPDLLRATLALRGPTPDSAFDFGKTPSHILEALQSLEARFSTTATTTETGRRNNAEVMHQMAWLLHWTFWIVMRYYMTQPKGAGERWADVVEQLFSEKALQTVAVVCPHLVRYYVVLVLPDRKRTEHVWLVIGLITAIKHKLDDPLVRFALAIFNDTNLVEAQSELARLAQLSDDFFLADREVRRSVLANARLFVFEHYCRIHRSLALETVRNLAIEDDADQPPATVSEKWVVTLIKDAKVDATFDAAEGIIHMTTTPTNPYAALLEKSKNTFYKTSQLVKSLHN